MHLKVNNDKMQLILHDKNIMKGILLLAIPIMLNNILKAFHDFIDTFMVSKIQNDIEIVRAQIASISFVSPIFNICQALAIGLMTAGAALMSQYIGAKKEEKATKVSGQLILLCIIIGLIFNAVLFFGAPIILKLMNADGYLFDYSLIYLRIRSFELVALFIFYAYQSTRQSLGDTLIPVIINVASIILNIILTAIFIFVFKLGLTGAAIGTLIANVSIVPICIYHLRKTNKLKLEYNNLKPDSYYDKKLLKLGIPAAIAQAFTNLAFLIINALIKAYDGAILTPIAIGGRINSMLLFPVMGIGTVLATFIGRNIGAGNIKRAKKCYISALLLSIIITICGALIIMPLRSSLAGWFLKDAVDIAICSDYLCFLLLGLPLMGIFQCHNGLLQGAGRTDFVLILATTRLWVLRIPVLLLMLYVFKIGYQSVWICMVISNFGSCIIGLILYWFVDFKPRTTKLQQRIKEVLLKE